MVEMSQFFNALAERAYKENDLSDVTYALCQSDIVFRQFFLDFFFQGAGLNAKDVDIWREYSLSQGRPDFWIHDNMKNEYYVVEVKIWDRNHHFEQYHKALLDSKNHVESQNLGNDIWKRIGYIANYSDIKEVKVTAGGDTEYATDVCGRVATWSEFIKGLARYAAFNDPMIQAYVGYVKALCQFDEFEMPNDWKICVNAVKDFLNDVTSAIEKSYRIYTGSPRYYIAQQRIGRFFEVDVESGEGDAKTTIWGWLGAYYTSKGAAVCVEFEDREGWGKWMCDKHQKDVKNGVLRIYMKHTDTSAGALGEFLGTAVESAKRDGGNLFDETQNHCRTASEVENPCREILSLKCLPYALENDFSGPLGNVGRYEIAIDYGKDQEVPESHCGRYFEMRKRDLPGDGVDNASAKTNEEGIVWRGWIGMLYSNGCKLIHDNTEFGTAPSFVVELRNDKFKELLRVLGKEKIDGWEENNWGWFDFRIEDGKWSTVVEKAKTALANIVGLLDQATPANTDA